ncbi:competence type IV pilus minor pilin ComGG [Sporolactobacillus sp. STCC-11]|uniref:competence type IV pilus minor pilin ComGG n=1 Tax=Sporolactobacillus caesalpiniae TaxID=3230362 RepID=UPI00339827B5
MLRMMPVIHNNTNQKGFILPLTMILSLMLLAFVFHALLLLTSDRQFFRQSYSRFQLQQLRECTLTDLKREMKQKTLPNKGTFLYHKGTVQFIVTENVDSVTIKFTILGGESQEIDQIIYSKESGKPINWLERLNR